MNALIEFDNVCKYYQMGDTTVKAADHISMKINKGEFVAIVGQSGSGKSTCMNIIGCLDVPTAGTYRLNGRDVGKMNKNELAEIRNEMLGFIFQQYNLLPKLSLLENVEVPLVYAGIPLAETRCCWPTSPPARWTVTPAARCWGCCRSCTGRGTPWCSSPTTTPLRCRPSGSSGWRMGVSSTTATPTPRRRWSSPTWSSRTR